MKSVSRIALSFAAASMALTAASGVWAADDAKPKKEKKEKKEKDGKDKPAAGPAEYKAKPSKEFSAVYEPVVKAYLKSKDAATAATSWPAIKAAIKTEDDRYTAGVFGIQVGSGANNEAMRIEAVEFLIAATVTPADQRAFYSFNRGAIAYDARDWPTALANLKKSYELGYRANNIEGGTEILIADALGQQKNYVEALDWLKKAQEGSKVAGAKPLPAEFDKKMLGFATKTNDYRYIGPVWQMLIRKNPTPTYWHDGLIYAYNSLDFDTQEILDLMRLMRTAGAMQYQQDYGIYANESIAAFFPTEMKGLLEEGFAKNTITKSNLTYSERYNDVVQKLKDDPFSVAQLDQDIANAKTGYEAAVSGDIALSVGEYARAAKAYELALAKGPVMDPKEKKDLTDRTVMRLGVAKAKLGDADGARAEFAKVTTPNRRAIADFWLIYLEQQAAAKPAA